MKQPGIAGTGRICAIAISVTLAALLAGCGERPTFPISGKVTYKGKLVPAGTVVFVPDTAAGNSGSSAVAEIKNGAYATELNKGVYGGPYLVQVNGSDGVPAESGEGGLEERGKALFSQYEKKVDLPAQEHVLDIEVPVTAPPKPGAGKKAAAEG